jgi:hypothetical protein
MFINLSLEMLLIDDVGREDRQPMKESDEVANPAASGDSSLW